MHAWPRLIAAFLALGACSKDPPTSTAPGDAAEAGATVVRNVDAQPGDTTTCPYSGRTFVVKAEHPKVDYEGRTYTICSETAAEAVRADPGKYLDDFTG
jgi:YHS domain-containing protein